MLIYVNLFWLRGLIPFKNVTTAIAAIIIIIVFAHWPCVKNENAFA